MSDIQVTSVDGSQINVSTGTVVGPLPSLQLAAGDGIDIANAGGVSTISANLSIPSNLADLSNVNGTPTTGQVLAWNGTVWAPADDQTGGGSDVANLSDLADVSNAGAKLGQQLAWNGSIWEPVNPTAGGTTVNGLSGDLLIEGISPVSVESDGNLTLKVSLGPDVVTSPHLWQSADALVHARWTDSESASGRAANYTIEFADVSNVSEPSGGSTAVNGSQITVNMTVDEVTTFVNLAFVPEGDGIEAALSNPDQSIRSFVSGDGWTPPDFSATIDYLPGIITAAGNVSIFASSGDALGGISNYSLQGTATATAHGTPSPPVIAFARSDADLADPIVESGTNVLLDIESTPHERGFYDYADMTFFVEAAPNSTSPWVSLGNVTSTSAGIVEVTSNLTGLSGHEVRAWSQNPLGKGGYSYGIIGG